MPTILELGIRTKPTSQFYDPLVSYPLVPAFKSQGGISRYWRPASILVPAKAAMTENRRCVNHLGARIYFCGHFL